MTIALGPIRPGKIVMGGALGVLASTLATDGEAGPAYPVTALSLPGDGALEISAWITRWPTLGTLTLIGDTGQFDYAGATDYFLWELRVGNLVVATDIGYGPGISRVNLVTDASGATITGNIDLDAAVAGGAMGGAGTSGLSGDVALGGVAPSGGLVGNTVSVLGGNVDLSDVSLSGLMGDGTTLMPGRRVVAIPKAGQLRRTVYLQPL